MIPAYLAVRKAFELYQIRDSIAYMYGAHGEVCTHERFDELVKLYPEYYGQFTDQDLIRIRTFTISKIIYDCSSFVSACFGTYAYSAALWERCSKRTSVKDGNAGSVLYKPGHVGLDIGYGYAMHIPTCGHTIEIVKNDTVGFTGSGELDGHDYTMMTNY